MEKTKAKVNDFVKGDEWSFFVRLGESDEYKDESFPGCEFRLDDSGHPLHGIAVNVRITGLPKWNGSTWQSRCKIEFVGDGEPSTFTGGAIYQKTL